MTLRSFLLPMAVLIVIGPSSAHATSCGEWNSMPEAKKWDRIDRMIDDAVSGSGGRSYDVNRDAIGRCLADSSENMFWDFNDLCADSKTAGMSALRTRFKNYIWTCAN